MTQSFRKYPLFILGVLAWVLVVAAVVSAVAIFIHEPVVWDFTAKGFKFAVELYQVPINCFAAAVALLTVHVTMSTLTQLTYQSAVATWGLTETNFIAFVKNGEPLPLSALNSAPFSDEFDSSTSSDELFEIKYPSPTTTFRRIYDARGLGLALEPPPNPHLLVQLGRVDHLYREMKALLKVGKPAWLSHFVDLCTATRQLRLYLVLTTISMRSWNHTSVLENHEEFGKKTMPPFKDGLLSTALTGVRSELLCIASTLHFSHHLEDGAERVREIAMSVGSVFAHADDNAKAMIGNVSMQQVWNESHQLEQRKITI